MPSSGSNNIVATPNEFVAALFLLSDWPLKISVTFVRFLSATTLAPLITPKPSALVDTVNV